MSDLLQGLNPAQRRAVEAIHGPVLVLAGPGSGKTRVLTHRIAYLIRHVGVDPLNILAVTFTNKAAKEMRERLEALVGHADASALTVGTFHSLCARFLRRDINHLGRERDFSVYDGDDQDRLMRRVLRDLNLDEKQNPPRAIHARISSAKNELVSPAEYARLNRTYFDEIVARCYERYQALLREANALDFDDLLVETVRLFDQHPEVLARYQDRYAYLLVDEYQDTNRPQYLLVKQLAAKHGNLFVVGDDDQCLPAGSLVRTLDGERPIEQIQPGDTVIAAAGRGATVPARVLRVRSRPYSGKLIRATLAGGQVLEATPNHMCFARLGSREDVHYVYLMYREDKGYRIGHTVAARGAGNGGVMNSLQARLQQEKADAAWVLCVCDSRADAHVLEHYYSVNYHIPTALFHAESRVVSTWTTEVIDWLYSHVDTRRNAGTLVWEANLSLSYPHVRAQNKRKPWAEELPLVTLVAFGGGAPTTSCPWYGHVMRWYPSVSSSLMTEDVPVSSNRSSLGSLKKHKSGRSEFGSQEIGTVAVAAELVAKEVGGADVARWAVLTRGQRQKFAFQPAAHLRPTMIVPVWRDGQIMDEEIVSVEEIDYEGMIYDLDVEHLHNYIVSNITIHNSVYGWRGADVRNIRQFEQDYPKAQVILLEQNYRSTQSILDTAQAVINAGLKRKHVKQLWTENGEGLQVSLHDGFDQDAEAAFVADEVARLIASGDFSLRDCAVMYRTNAQSRALEEALSRRGLRYQLIGGLRFWERKEIKDTLAYLRVAFNPYDSVNLTRILNWPARGIGERTEAELTRWAAELGVPVFQALSEVETPGARTPFNTRTLTALRSFFALIVELGEARRELPLVELIARVLDRVGLREAFVREYGAEVADERWANIEELAAFAARYSELPQEVQLPTFLEEVALVADLDRLDTGADVVTLITLHQAKGLEYPAVFLVGLEEGLLPHGRSSDDRDKLEEERRLLYVGITRAKRRLYLCYAIRRTSFGRTSPSTPSRFLADIPRELLKQPGGRGASTSPQAGMFGGRGVGASYGGARTPPRPPSPQGRADAASWGGFSSLRQGGADAPTEITYFPGQRVRHDRFGEGVVVSSRLVDGDEEVTISFADRERRILAGLARLQRMDG